MGLGMFSIGGRERKPGSHNGQRFSPEAYHILEMIARDEPLDTVLGEVACTVERLHSGSACSVSVLRDGCLFAGATGSLPADYASTLNGIPIEAAPYWSRSIVVGDIAAEPRWMASRATLREHGFHHWCSVPIASGAGEALGVIAVYQQQDSASDGGAMESAKLAAQLAGMAIEHRNLIDELAYQAHHDSLTKLPNRLLFEERLQQTVSVARRYGHSAALLYLDLDRFKLVNDLLGYSTGDLLLEHVAKRLEGRLRRSDTLARAGGDEFVVLLPAGNSSEGACKVARDLLDALREPFRIGEHELVVSASIGISMYPEDGDDAAALERHAASAMYHAKRAGKNTFQRFAGHGNAATPERLELETHLRRALERGELFLEYQPQLNLERRELAGVEALLRWKHPQLGLISPATFIPIAEEAGLIVPIGGWVLERACRQAKTWQKAGHGAIRVAVNVSALQFARPDFTDSVRAALSAADLEPQRLELEVTESLVMGNIDEAVRRMSVVRELGAQIAIDDFGTGHSSLSYLQVLPVDALKIDRSFVGEILQPADRPPLVHSIIALAHRLGKRIVAEGVETESQADALREMGCDEGQGYVFGRVWEPACGR